MRIKLLIALTVICCQLFAQDKWTPEEIIHTQYLSAPLISNDGNYIVWSKRIGLKDQDKFVNKYFITRMDVVVKGKPLTVQLTRGKSSEYNAFFDKDQKGIYFLSSREKGKKLWHLSFYGGEPQEIHEFKNGISNVQRIDGTTVAFVSNEGKTFYQLNNEKSKDNTIIVEDSLNWRPTRVFAFNLQDKKIRRLTDNQQAILSYSVSRDGQYLISRRLMTLHYATDGQIKPEITLYNLKTNTSKVVLQAVHQASSFEFTPDNQGFYFMSTSTSDKKWNGAGKEVLNYYDLSTGEHQEVPLNWKNGSGYRYVLAGNALLTSLANGPYKKVGVYVKNKGTWRSNPMEWNGLENHVSIQGVSENGRYMVYNHSTAMQLPSYFLTEINRSKKGILSLGSKREIVELNTKLKKKPVAQAEVIYWKGANGAEVNGILYYPKGYQAGQQYPLILSIHGGPTGVDQDSWSERWSTYPQIYTDKGAFVLKPNYHGSGLHGQAFAESIKNGKYYELDQIDLYNGIQHLNKQGKVNMEQLGLMGWSNGAILTTWMTVKYPDMFKVAAPGAGDVNWTSDYGTCRFGVTFDQYYMGGAPWDDTDGKKFNTWYIENSPIFEIEKIKTPTIIFHGSEDRAVPRDQGWEYYRGLQQVGKAPVRFLWFPGQPHGLRKITHQLRKMKEEIKWIDNYLFGKIPKQDNKMKPSSPLAMAIRSKDIQNQNGAYGVLVKDKLIPEVMEVKKDSISIGIFELTNAQYAAFQKNHSYSPVHANYPVVGLSQDQIEAYLNWLNALTGAVYRLPKKQEALKLQDKAHATASSENTLNNWAGYAITLDDAVLLKSKLIKEEVQLLKGVGNYQPVEIGSARIFDLGGNVAEWYLDGKELKCYGYDAYNFVDPYNTAPIKMDKIGVRLIKD